MARDFFSHATFRHERLSPNPFFCCRFRSDGDFRTDLRMEPSGHLIALACGLSLRVRGDETLVARALFGISTWFLSARCAGEGIEWSAEFVESSPSPRDHASWSAKTDGERCDTIWGAITLNASLRECRIEMPDPRGLGHLIHIAVGGMLRHEGMTQLHCAAIVPGDGDTRAFLVAGASGAGKTTLTLNLATRGWMFLTDDSVAVGARADGSMRALPVRQRFMLVREGDTFKCPLDPEDEFPGQRLWSSEVGAIVFLDRTPSRTSTIEPLSRVEALARLPALTHSFGVAAATRAPFGALARIASLPAFVLHAGADVPRGGGSADIALRSCRFLELSA